MNAVKLIIFFSLSTIANVCFSLKVCINLVNYHNLGGLKPEKFILSELQRLV